MTVRFIWVDEEETSLNDAVYLPGMIISMSRKHSWRYLPSLSFLVQRRRQESIAAKRELVSFVPTSLAR